MPCLCKCLELRLCLHMSVGVGICSQCLLVESQTLSLCRLPPLEFTNASPHTLVCVCVYVCLHACVRFGALPHTSKHLASFATFLTLNGLTPQTRNQLQSLFTPVAMWLGLQGGRFPVGFTLRVHLSSRPELIHQRLKVRQEKPCEEGRRLSFPFHVLKSPRENEGGSRALPRFFFSPWKNISSLETRLILRFHSGHATWVSPPFLTLTPNPGAVQSRQSERRYCEWP